MLSSMVKKIDTATYLATKSVVDKTFQGGTITLGIKENGVGYARSTKVNTPKEVLDLVEKYKKAIIDGTIKIPVSL
jgi:basic membrane protein A